MIISYIVPDNLWQRFLEITQVTPNDYYVYLHRMKFEKKSYYEKNKKLCQKRYVYTNPPNPTKALQ